MKKLVLLTILMGVLPLSMMAQDDMYFTPKKGAKGAKTVAAAKVNDDKPVYHSGSNRHVDEYNRHGKFGSYFEKIGTDSLGNDIIEFHSSAEDLADTLAVYPYESVQYDPEDDYAYSRRMNWFDDFYWYDPWYFRYSGYNPYFWTPGYYHWFDPWYYSWYGGWYDPWYPGSYWGGWYSPYWYGRYGYYGYGWGWGVPSYHVSYGNGVTGTGHHGYVGRPASRNSATTAGRGHFGGYRGNGQSTQAYDRTRSGSTNINRSSSGRFGGSRSGSTGTSTRSYTPSYSGGSYSSGGGSFGGSSGGSRGGGSSSGGGHFGGRR